MTLQQHNKYHDYACDEDGNVYSNKTGNWLKMNPTLNTEGYYVVSIYNNKIRKHIKVHIFVYSCFKGEITLGLQIDHIDRNKQNNNINNLRAVPQTINQQNRRKLSKGESIYKGVSLNSKKTRWTSKIRINKVLCHLGSFGSEIEAARSYDKKAKELGYTTNVDLGLLLPESEITNSIIEDLFY